jgi:hypothetical protein
MTAEPLLTLTQEAQSALDRYFRRVKAALRAHPSVDADEVERDIRSHIEAELGELPTPIAEARVRSVLDRLGSPNQWVPGDERPMWQRLLVSLRSGPEDWRLPYVTFALFVAGPLTGPIGGVLCFVASIFVARATLALLEEEGEPVGARRWFVYPPLLMIYGAIVVAIFIAVPGVIATAADPSVRTGARSWFPEPFVLTLPLVTGFSGGLWWTLLGLLLGRRTHAVHLIFWPFADWFEWRHGIRIALIGLCVAAVAGAGLAAVVWAW